MKRAASLYRRHRFPPQITQHAVWLHHRCNLSTRDIEDLLAERGISVSCESIRLWRIKLDLGMQGDCSVNTEAMAISSSLMKSS
jgi:transposase-like protein